VLTALLSLTPSLSVVSFFFLTASATTPPSTLSLHDALPISPRWLPSASRGRCCSSRRWASSARSSPAGCPPSPEASCSHLGARLPPWAGGSGSGVDDDLQPVPGTGRDERGIRLRDRQNAGDQRTQIYPAGRGQLDGAGVHLLHSPDHEDRQSLSTRQSRLERAGVVTRDSPEENPRTGPGGAERCRNRRVVARELEDEIAA